MRPLGPVSVKVRRSAGTKVQRQLLGDTGAVPAVSEGTAQCFTLQKEAGGWPQSEGTHNQWHQEQASPLHRQVIKRGEHHCA